MKKLSVKSIVAIAIGTALWFVLSKFVSVPSPVPNTYICLQYGLGGFLAVLFGPIVGCLVGLLGHLITDMSGGGIWWSWVIPSAVFCLLTGLGCNKIDLDDGVFSTKEIVRFNICQVVAHAIAWILIAPVGDILIYAEPAGKVFAQGFMAFAANAVTTAIVGTLLCVVYAKTRPQKGSLKKED